MQGERLNESCVQSTIKHGGGCILIWGFISAIGVGDLVNITDKLTADKYKQIHAVNQAWN